MTSNQQADSAFIANEEYPAEIERRFLLAESHLCIRLDGYEKAQIMQGYLPYSRIRLRQLIKADGSEEYYQTHKIGAGLKRLEKESPISKEQFYQLWPNTLCRRLEKDRYYLPWPENDLERHVLEIDVYRDEHLRGLMIVEVEFKSPEDAEDFLIPPWFGKEITDNNSYSNYHLATIGLLKGQYDLEVGINLIINESVAKLSQSGESVVIGFAGGSASGKAEALAKQVALALERDRHLSVINLPMDNYFIGNSKMSELGISNWDDPRAIDLDIYSEHLRLLKSGESIEMPIYDFVSGERQGVKIVHPASIVITDGLFVLQSRFNKLIDLGVYVDASFHSRFWRRIKRDANKRTSQQAREVADYVLAIESLYQQHVHCTRDNADIIIRNECRSEEYEQLPLVHQVKFEVSEVDNFPERIKAALKAKKPESTNNVDRYCQNYHSESAIVRLRERSLSDSDNYDYFISLSYKNQSIKDSPQFKISHQFIIPNLGTGFYKKLLDNQLYREALVIEVDRLEYKFKGVTLRFDSVCVEERDGKLDRSTSVKFLELSGQPKDIEVFVKKLGLDISRVITQSYFEIFANSQNK